MATLFFWEADCWHDHGVCATTPICALLGLCDLHIYPESKGHFNVFGGSGINSQTQQESGLS